MNPNKFKNISKTFVVYSHFLVFWPAVLNPSKKGWNRVHILKMIKLIDKPNEFMSTFCPPAKEFTFKTNDSIWLLIISCLDLEFVVRQKKIISQTSKKIYIFNPFVCKIFTKISS